MSTKIFRGLLKDNSNEENDEIKIKGKFRIYLGNELYAKGKNKWTRYFASSVMLHVAQHRDPFYSARYMAGMSFNYTARAGGDTSTPTDPNMSDLVSKIDIAPNTQSRIAIRSDDLTSYQSKFTFTWNPDVIPAQTIGEFGIYLFLTDDTWTSPYEKPNFQTYLAYADHYIATLLPNADVRLAARISSADGDFDPIDYTGEESIVLEWYVTIKF